MNLQGDFYQIGIVVRDIDEGMAHYQELLGVGPFWRLDTDYEGRYREWRGRFANRNAFTRWGNVYLEMDPARDRPGQRQGMAGHPGRRHFSHGLCG